VTQGVNAITEFGYTIILHMDDTLHKNYKLTAGIKLMLHWMIFNNEGCKGSSVAQDLIGLAQFGRS
jgi:hypothetical protein